ncbi:MAG TPA: adenylate/guanylate cyclase domain-containing protein [Gaiellaceae bacterium]|nr:adenylate/guanylate cyclase domain-containing protein [Gaiellaceae bacterium]
MAIPTGTVTFVFVDIEGSTRLMQQLGTDYEECLRQFRSIVRSGFSAHDGHEIDTQGDAFFYSFPRAREAVAAAVDVQRALANADWPQAAEVRVRTGLHTGEPAVGDEGYLGLDVVRASRICSAGHGGQILLSEATRALLGDAVPPGTDVIDLGTQTLKDVRDEHLFQVSVDGQRDHFPALKTAEEPAAPKSRADVLGERFEEQIQSFVAERLERSLNRVSSPQGVLERDGIEALRQRSPRSPAGWIVRGTFTIVLLVLAAAFVVWLVRLLF